MICETLRELKVAMNLARLPDGTKLTVAPGIVFVPVGEETIFEMTRDEFAMEALQMLGIPAELWTEKGD